MSDTLNNLFKYSVCKKAKKYFWLKRMIIRNTVNNIKYGCSSPNYLNRVWVDPNLCNKAIYLGERTESGRVIKRSWPYNKSFKIKDEFKCIKYDKLNHQFKNDISWGKIINYKIKACYCHWVEGFSWEETGIYNLMLTLSTLDLEGIKNRYNNLDHIFDQVQREGMFRVVEKESIEHYYKGTDGLIHIGPKGYLFYGGMGGNHRLAIAKILNIPYPAYIGVTHLDGLNTYEQISSVRY